MLSKVAGIPWGLGMYPHGLSGGTAVCVKCTFGEAGSQLLINALSHTTKSESGIKPNVLSNLLVPRKYLFLLS